MSDKPIDLFGRKWSAFLYVLTKFKVLDCVIRRNIDSPDYRMHDRLTKTRW